MQFERLKKNYRKQIVIGGLILVCITSAITITTTRAKYKLTEDIPLVRGYIDYIADREKPTISNVTTAVTKTEINVTVTASDNVGVTEYWYQIGTNTAVKGTGNTYQFTGLTAGTTYSVKVYVKDAAGNQSDTTTKSVTTNKPSGSETILGNITIKTGTPDFSKVATTDEGVYKVSDGMYGGTSYYWRGATTNNYVKFAGLCWRIVRINGNKTMRLIYDGRTCHANGTKTAESVVMGATDAEKHYSTTNGKANNSSYVGWTYSLGSQRTTGGTASNAKTQTEKWYNANITGTNASKVADGKFCNDRNVGQPLANWSGYITTWSTNGTKFAYAGPKRLYEDYTPTLSCTYGDVYTLKVGAITADEVTFAGGKNENNTSYYLYNGQYYWTMSPFYWEGNYSGVFYVAESGYLGSTYVNAYRNGLRPVINLRSDITFSSGNGTKSNPYVVA